MKVFTITPLLFVRELQRVTAGEAEHLFDAEAVPVIWWETETGEYLANRVRFSVWPKPMELYSIAVDCRPTVPVADELIDIAVKAMSEAVMVELGQLELVHDPRFAGKYELCGVDLKVLARAALEAVGVVSSAR